MALFAIVFSITLGLSIMNPFLPIYLKEIGAGGIGLALIFSGYSFGKICLSPYIGRLSDREGRSRFLKIGLGIHVLVSSCYFCLPGHVLSLIFLRLLQGMGAAMVRPVASALIGERAPRGKEGVAMGSFDISFYAALALGPILGGVLNDRLGYPGIFGAFLALSCFSFMVSFLGVRRIHSMAPPSRALTEAGVRITESRTLFGLCCFVFTRSFGITLVAIFLPIVMKTQMSLSNLQIGVVIASGTLCTAVFLRPFGKISDRCSRRTLVIVGGAVSALLTIALPFAEGFYTVWLLYGCMGSFSAMSLPSSSALLLDEGHRFGIGFAMGFFHSVIGMGFLVAPLLAGIVLEFGLGRLILPGAGLLGLIGVLLFAVLHASGHVAKPLLEA